VRSGGTLVDIGHLDLEKVYLKRSHGAQ